MKMLRRALRARRAVRLATTPTLVLAFVLALVALGSCTRLREFRTVHVVATESGSFEDRVCLEQAPNSPDDRCSLERRTYTYEGEEHDYYFAVVELDDQGWFWDRRQMESLLRLLYGLRDENGDERDFLIFAHAHGWQHNANACDDNVVCFQRLIERLDVSERGFLKASGSDRKPRAMVGIYLAWRGKSGTVPTLRATTFWARKRAARRVGIGGVTELLTRLDDFRGARNPGRESSGTQLIVSGHSFGGFIIYRALAQNLIERAVQMNAGDRDRNVEGDYGYGIASSFGDLVVLINPAFEGSAYESLQTVATSRCYPEVQRPALLVITSKADDATRRTFPLGRFLSNLASQTRCREQRKAVLHTVGHLERYRTHDLVVANPRQPVEPPQERKDGPCGCPYLTPTEQFQRGDEDQEFYAELRRVTMARNQDGPRVYEPGTPAGYDSLDQFLESSYGPDISGGQMVLQRSPEYAANYPYLVLSTTADYIPDHSTIYGERFTDFLRRFYFRHLVWRLNFPAQCFDNPNPQCLDTDITPCGRSWTGAFDYGCPGESTP